jgi:glycosyltransferase involved in cell wall biosynthesis
MSHGKNDFMSKLKKQNSELSAKAILLSLNNYIFNYGFETSCTFGDIITKSLRLDNPNFIHKRSIQDIIKKYNKVDISIGFAGEIKSMLFEIFNLNDNPPSANDIQCDPLFSIPDNAFGAAFLYFLIDIGSLSSHKKLASWLEFRLEAFKLKMVLGAILSIAQVAYNTKLEKEVMEICLGDNAQFFDIKKMDELCVPFLAKPWKPKISILCTAFNHEAYIEKAITSFFEQDTAEPFEVIVADDASSDNTLEILRYWKKQFPEHIKVLKFEENLYQKWRSTSEVLLAEASGEYIAICEGDDFWVDPRKLRIQGEILDQNKRLVSTTHNLFVFDMPKMVLREYSASHGSFLQKAEQSKTVEKYNHLNTILFRNCFDRFPVELNATRNGDYLLTAFLGNYGDNMHLTDLFGSVWRQNPFSSWMPLAENEKNEGRFLARFCIFEMNKRLGNTNVISKCEKHLSIFNINDERKGEIMNDALKRISAAANFSPYDHNFTYL